MAFIPRAELEHRAPGQWVRLTRDVDVVAGRFQRGTRMKIVRDSDRGLDLVDEEGNSLIETGILGDFYEPTADPVHDFRDKN